MLDRRRHGQPWLVALTSDSKSDDFAPNWRADGRKLAFNSDRLTFANPEGDHEIFIANADGSHVKQITFNALDDEDPAWSQDGRRIAFAQDRRRGLPASERDGARGGFGELYTMCAEGGDEVRRTTNSGFDIHPDWQPLP